jgi:tyrosyl-tRNA synthetase
VKSDFLAILKERGFIHQATDLERLDALMASRKFTAYVGFDCTGTSLHVGSLIPIMMLRHLQKCGHTPIVLIGGGTTKVGDPSGKTETRQLLSDKEIAANIKGIRQNFDAFLRFGKKPGEARLLNNDAWLAKLAYIPFLRDIGRHFTVNKMLALESVKLRLEREQPLTFLEFNYMVIQAYDFLELYRREKCLLQMGGSDQWGNIVNGADLIRRVEGKEAFGLTGPLVTTADGEKMGKTAKGAVWLSPDRVSDYDYWQHWRNTRDEDIGRFLRLFTELPLKEIALLERLKGEEMNEAKAVLATEATTLCRGRKAAAKAVISAKAAFGKGTGEVPTLTIPRRDLAGLHSNIDFLAAAGACASKSEARRLIQQGGVRFEGKRISDPLGRDFNPGGTRVQIGKKRHFLIKAG